MRERARSPRAGPTSLAESVTKSVEILVFGVAPLLVPLWLLVTAWRSDKFAVDFHYVFWPAARHVLGGSSPFPALTSAIGDGTSFVYPAPAALLLAPFGTVPLWIAELVFTALLAAALMAALRVLKIRDRRCYAVVLFWPPIVYGLQTANLTLFLVLGLAVLWRVRDHSTLAGVVCGVLVALKVFLFPLIIWLVARRRYSSATWSVVVAIIVTVLAWSAIGFAGLVDYPQMLRLLDHVEARTSYSLVAFGLKLGLNVGPAHALSYAAGVIALGLAFLLARREQDGRYSFTAVVFAAILFSPIVWLHYFSLLLVPFAILRERFSALWVAPAALWLCPVGLSGPSWYPLAPLLAFCLMLFVAALPQESCTTSTGRRTVRSALS